MSDSSDAIIRALRSAAAEIKAVGARLDRAERDSKRAVVEEVERLLYLPAAAQATGVRLSVIYRWLEDDAEFAAAIEIARQIAKDTLEETILDAARSDYFRDSPHNLDPNPGAVYGGWQVYRIERGERTPLTRATWGQQRLTVTTSPDRKEPEMGEQKGKWTDKRVAAEKLRPGDLVRTKRGDWYEVSDVEHVAATSAKVKITFVSGDDTASILLSSNQRLPWLVAPTYLLRRMRKRKS